MLLMRLYSWTSLLIVQLNKIGWCIVYIERMINWNRITQAWPKTLMTYTCTLLLAGWLCKGHKHCCTCKEKHKSAIYISHTARCWKAYTYESIQFLEAQNSQKQSSHEPPLDNTEDRCVFTQITIIYGVC